MLDSHRMHSRHSYLPQSRKRCADRAEATLMDPMQALSTKRFAHIDQMHLIEIKTMHNAE
jgi:hypothetical protein